MKSLRQYLQDKPIRFKMFFTYAFIVTTALTLVGLGVYYQVTKGIEKGIENELSNATASILNMVETTAQSSIKNYLRSVAEKNLEIVSRYHSDVKNNYTTEGEVKIRLREILFSQTIGTTGYIYCIDSNGTAVLHPNASVEGVNFAHFEFIKDQMRRKEGYLEYEWRNPGESEAKPKALYMTYFEPWDWIISVSSYRSEFKQLINISDFRESILSLHFGATGYSYVIDSHGNVVVHPVLAGNLLDARDAEGNYLVRRQIETKNGKLVYSWRNPGEKRYRDKIVIYNYIPEYDWIVASTGYLEEFYAPLKSVRNTVVATVVLIVLLVLPATFTIAGNITRPLRQLEKTLSQTGDGNFSGRMSIEARDEIGNLGVYFNQFMDRLEKEISERRRTEELFSKAFRASPSGFFIAGLADNRLIDANRSFLNSIGRSRDDVVGKTLTELSLFQQPHSFGQMSALLRQDGRVRDMEVVFTDKSGEKRLGIINIEVVHIWDQQCALCTMADLTETRQLENEIIDISERERLQLGQYLHDDLCSHLLGVEVMQKVLRQNLAKKGYEDLMAVDKVRDLVQDAIEKARRISRGLCPTHIAGRNLALALDELCRDIETIYDVSCALKYEGGPFLLEPGTATHIYYIAREAAYNAVKHGQASNIYLKISRDGDVGVLTIIDDGTGLPDTVATTGMGIRIMNYRAKRIGAALSTKRLDDAGTCIMLHFNMNHHEETRADDLSA
jgi:PAS domain S-box-containing protein